MQPAKRNAPQCEPLQVTCDTKMRPNRPRPEGLPREMRVNTPSATVLAQGTIHSSRNSMVGRAAVTLVSGDTKNNEKLVQVYYIAGDKKVHHIT